MSGSETTTGVVFGPFFSVAIRPVFESSFGSTFLIDFGSPRGAPGASQGAPGASQDHPKKAQEGPKSPPRPLKTTQDKVFIEKGIEKGIEEDSKLENSMLLGYD